MRESKQIIVLVIISRFIIILWQALSNWFIPDHDAGVFVPPRDPNINRTSCDQVIEIVLGGFRRWDAQYFLHIAEHGYTYENTVAFFPLFPFCIRYSTYMIQAVVPNAAGCSFREISLVMAVLLNMIFFAKAAIALFNLTEIVFADRKLSRIAVFLFCLNPASVFFVAPYTESLFCWLSFSVMLNCVKRNFVKALIFMIFGIMCRSNGTVNIGFILYYALQTFFTSKTLVNFFRAIFEIVVAIIWVSITFIAIQNYFNSIYCKERAFEMKDHIMLYGLMNNYVVAGEIAAEKSPWCLNELPFSYSYVQERYWNVGFLRYYEFKQIPNFLLAAPVLFMILFHSLNYFIKNLNITLCLGFTFGSQRSNLNARQFVFVVHVLFLSIFCLFFVHIQVSTRMLASSSPYLYWVCAQYFRNESKNSKVPKVTTGTVLSKWLQIFQNEWEHFFGSRKIVTKFIKYWFVGYCIVGTVLFSNFLPWT